MFIKLITQLIISIDFDTKSINKILVQIFQMKLARLSFKSWFIFSNDKILPPSYRSDIKTQNDISEELLEPMVITT